MAFSILIIAFSWVLHQIKGYLKEFLQSYNEAAAK